MTECLADWYHGVMSSEMAFKLCSEVGTDGAFLIRESGSMAGKYVLSYCLNKDVYHHYIEKNERGLFQLKSVNDSFVSLEDLVKFYRLPRTTFFQTLSTPITKSFVKQSAHPEDDGYVSPLPPLQFCRKNAFLSTLLPAPTPSSHTMNITQQQNTHQAAKVPSRRVPPATPPKPKLSRTKSIPLSATKPKTVSLTRRLSNVESVNRSVFSTLETGKGSHRLSLDESSFKHMNDISQMFGSHGPLSLPSQAAHNSPTQKGASSHHSTLPSKVPQPPTVPTIPESHAIQSNTLVIAEEELTLDMAKRPGLQVEELQSSKPETTFILSGDTHNEEEFLQHTPVTCTTTFLTVTEFGGEASAMGYSRGAKMMLRGVRVDGWWYCLNETTNQEGWVLQNNLEPVRNQRCNNEKQFNSTAMDDTRHTPVTCETVFETTMSCRGQRDAMEYVKGSRMVLKGVRVDGWWYCMDRTTKETGWVLQDNLKPMPEQGTEGE